MKRQITFKCTVCGFEELLALPPWLRGKVHTCPNCATRSKLRARIVRSALIGVTGPAIAWAAYRASYPEMPPYVALLLAAAVVMPLAFVFRAQIIAFTATWKVDMSSK